MTAGARPVMLVTGGSGSIGGAVAAKAVQAGWNVALHGRDVRRLHAVRERISAASAEAMVSNHIADFDGQDAISALVAEVAAAHGRIDALIDCAVTGPPGVTGPFLQTDPNAYAALSAASVAAFQRLCHATLPWLQRQGGTMIALVSDAGCFAAANQSMIGAARAGTIGFVRNLAVEVARDNVRMHAIAPSYVEGTETIKRLEAAGSSRLERARSRAGLGLPNADDIAALALFLCSDGAQRMTGQIFSVNGGLNA